MMKIVLFLLCSIVLASGNLFVFPACNVEKAYSLVEIDIAVKGVFEKFCVASSDRIDVLEGQDAIDIGGYDELKTQVMIIHRVEKTHGGKEWIRKMQSAFPVNADLELRFVATNFAVVVARKENLRHDGPTQKLFSVIPHLSKVVELSKNTIVLPYSRVFPKAENVFKLQEYSEGEKDPIPDIMAKVNKESLRGFLTELSENIVSRNSRGTGAKKAADYIQGVFDGYGMKTSRHSFREDYSDNVVADIPGTKQPEKFVIFGAHYDCVGSDRVDPESRAPGANDDGSGTGVLLELARVISESDLTFDYTLRFVAFSGEEQGLVGSKAYAELMKNENVQIHAMLQTDMIAYQTPNTPFEMSFPDGDRTPGTVALSEFSMNVVRKYVPELKVGWTTVCCTDHQSFYYLGYPATWFFEKIGTGIDDPYYHDTRDTMDRRGYNWDKVTTVTRAIVATSISVSQT